MPAVTPAAAVLNRRTLALADDRVGIADYAREGALEDFGWGIAEIMELL